MVIIDNIEGGAVIDGNIFYLVEDREWVKGAKENDR